MFVETEMQFVTNMLMTLLNVFVKVLGVFVSPGFFNKAVPYSQFHNDMSRAWTNFSLIHGLGVAALWIGPQVHQTSHMISFFLGVVKDSVCMSLRC